MNRYGQRGENLPFRYVIVGALVFAVDASLFNILISSKIGFESVTSKVVSGLIATVLAFYLHKVWTFGSRDYELATSRQAIIFGLVQLGGILIASTCIWISHYVLEFTSTTADNVSGNVIGLLFATLFRFYFNSKHVYR